MKYQFICSCGWKLKRIGTKLTRKQYRAEKDKHAQKCEAMRKSLGAQAPE